jgi:adenine-specific DNA-methyltransferase
MKRQKLQLGRRSQSALFEAPDNAGVLPLRTIVPADPLISPEARFDASVDADHRRRYAQFFTPAAVAAVMADMLRPAPGARLLDPACGPGLLIDHVAQRYPMAKLTAIDIDAVAAECLRDSRRAESTTDVLAGDFLSWDSDAMFDGIIANPPYLKYQQFVCASEVYERLGAVVGEEVSKFSNLYLLFLLESYRRLAPGGRLVFLVPGEWANANFGEPFKRFLAREGCLRTLIYFAHSKELFDDAMTTASVLELVKPGPDAAREWTFRSLYVHDAAGADAVRTALDGGCSSEFVRVATLDVARLSREKKWDYLLRHPASLHERTPGWRRLDEWCSTRRGIATGANEFFHLRPSRAQALGLQAAHLVRCVGGARHARGAVFDSEDYDALHAADQPCLLWAVSTSPTHNELAYVREGDAHGLPQRYLLSKRKPWYSMEKVNAAPIWIGVFGRGGLRVIRNRSGVAHLTTYHGLTPHDADPVLADALVVLLQSSIAVRAIERTRRVFGAGLEKVEPADLLDIELPDLPASPRASVMRLARCLPVLDAQWREQGAPSAALLLEIDEAAAALFAEHDAQEPLALQA